jgi:hypothetical protein
MQHTEIVGMQRQEARVRRVPQSLGDRLIGLGSGDACRL